MVKRPAIFISFILVCLGLLMIILFPNSPKSDEDQVTEIARIKPNFPYTLNMLFSHAMKKSDIINHYGESDETRILDQYNLDIWYKKDSSKMIAIYNKSNILLHLLQYKHPKSKEDYEKILMNAKTYEDILKEDPYTYLLEINEEASSEHILTDNILLHIDYVKEKNQWMISDYKFQDDILTFPDLYDLE